MAYARRQGSTAQTASWRLVCFRREVAMAPEPVVMHFRDGVRTQFPLNATQQRVPDVLQRIEVQ